LLLVTVKKFEIVFKWVILRVSFIKSEAFLETPGASLVCALSSTFGVAMFVVRF
jgi:hypothetical protein